MQPFINMEERSKEWEYHKSRFEFIPKLFVSNHVQVHEYTSHAAAPSADRFLRHSQFEILNVDAYGRSKNPKARWISPHEYRSYLMSMALFDLTTSKHSYTHRRGGIKGGICLYPRYLRSNMVTCKITPYTKKVEYQRILFLNTNTL